MSTTDRVEFTCPHCQKTLQVKAGRKISGPCPACGKDLAAARETMIQANVQQYMESTGQIPPSQPARTLVPAGPTTWQSISSAVLAILGILLLLMFFSSLNWMPYGGHLNDRFKDDNAYGAAANAAETSVKFVKWFCSAFFQFAGAVSCFVLRELRKRNRR